MSYIEIVFGPHDNSSIYRLLDGQKKLEQTKYFTKSKSKRQNLPPPFPK